jgi:hypothetical protein
LYNQVAVALSPIPSEIPDITPQSQQQRDLWYGPCSQIHNLIWTLRSSLGARWITGNR